jgi:hypothetical protein
MLGDQRFGDQQLLQRGAAQGGQAAGIVLHPAVHHAQPVVDGLARAQWQLEFAQHEDPALIHAEALFQLGVDHQRRAALQIFSISACR